MIPIVKGHYQWNDQNNCLEFHNENGVGENQDKKKKSRVGFYGHGFSFSNVMKDRNTPSMSLQAGNAGFKLGIHGPGQRISPRPGFLPQENSNVTLEHVKAVALREMEEEKSISTPFMKLFVTNQFNNFLITLLRYFECFLEGIEQQKRPQKTSYLQPSKAELKAMEKTKKKMSVAKVHLGQAYCLLLLGIGTEKQHHMQCGKQRVSSTHRDKEMYEDMYMLCTSLVYIAFRRRELESIQSEMGDMLRSPTFNPLQRQGRSTYSEENVAWHKPYVKDASKPIGDRIKDLLSVKLPEVEQTTPSAYRRQYGNRPAITRAIRQRSTALISLLPLPKETSEYLFKPTAAERKLAKKDTIDLDLDDSIQFDLYGSQKVGIIGEPMNLFDETSLIPKNVDNEDDAESNASESPLLQSNSAFKQSQEKQRTFSRVTTEASLPL